MNDGPAMNEHHPAPVSVLPAADLALAHAHQATRNPALSYLMSLQSAASRKTMGSHLTRVANLLGVDNIQDCPWERLTRQHVFAILHALQQQHLAPTTINTLLAAIKGGAGEARAMRLIDTDTFIDIKSVRSVRGSRLPAGRALTAREVAQLLGACERDKSLVAVRDLTLFKVMIGTGLRRREAISLTLADLREQDRSLLIRGKGNKHRRVFLPAGAYESLSYWLDQVRGTAPGPLFVRFYRYDTITHQPITAQSIYKALSKRCLEAGIEEASPHDLRRTFATNMLNEGIDTITLQRMMGHASLETTKKYDMRGENAMRLAADAHFKLF